MSILVTGGAGYIGSHCAALLSELSEEVVILDNLASGHREAAGDLRFYEGDVNDAALLDRVFESESIDAVVHFAACSLVGESMEKPEKYFRNNTMGVLSLLEAMNSHGVKNLVFSSTAAVYGQPESSPIREDMPLEPINPYGQSKLMSEQLLKCFDEAYGIRYAALRYFNVAGAYGGLGEDHRPETHLIPIVLQTALGQREGLTVFGDDYDTPDGSCIRDYIHVRDLVRAHALALDYLRKGGGSDAFNLGSSKGFSVMEIIKAAAGVTGLPLAYFIGPRRPGDPPILIASAEKAKSVLGWEPEFNDIRQIISSAWDFHCRLPQGFAK